MVVVVEVVVGVGVVVTVAVVVAVVCIRCTLQEDGSRRTCMFPEISHQNISRSENQNAKHKPN